MLSLHINDLRGVKMDSAPCVHTRVHTHAHSESGVTAGTPALSVPRPPRPQARRVSMLG